MSYENWCIEMSTFALLPCCIDDVAAIQRNCCNTVAFWLSEKLHCGHILSYHNVKVLTAPINFNYRTSMY